MRQLFLFFLCIPFIILSCSKDNTTSMNKDDNSNSGVQYSSVLELKDVIGTLDPWNLIDEPQYKSVQSVTHLQADSRVMLYSSGSDVYVYSLTNMYVEVINDIIDNKPIAITYCPQTMSGICWNRVIAGDTMSLSASGLLYRENQMPYDYQTNSIFSQMLQLGVRGKYIDREVHTYPLIEVNWQMVIDYFPDALVYTNDGDQGSPLKMDNVQTDQMYYGVVDFRSTTLFSSNDFDQELINVYTTAVSSKRLSFIGSKEMDFVIAYRNLYDMQAVQNEFPIVMQDETGTKWNIFGEAVSGSRKGEKLEAANAYMALGWAWRDLFETVNVKQY